MIVTFCFPFFSYKHDDGSYSAFGDSDPSGSTWLTAFVAKVFMFAGQMRTEFSEQLMQNINDALDFLVEQQQEDGSFHEPGKVSHKAMQVSYTLTPLFALLF